MPVTKSNQFGERRKAPPIAPGFNSFRTSSVDRFSVMCETSYAVQIIGKLPGFAPSEIIPMNEQLNGYRHNRQNKTSLSVLPMFQLSALELASFAHGHPITPAISLVHCVGCSFFFSSGGGNSSEQASDVGTVLFSHVDCSTGTLFSVTLSAEQT